MRKVFQQIRYDLILVGSLAILAGLSFVVIGLVKNAKNAANSGENAYAEVTCDGEILADLPLLQDGRYEFTSAYSGGVNVIEIKDGKVSCVSASCPDHICVNMGQKGSFGETIVCLPNRIVVTVVSEEEVRNER